MRAFLKSVTEKVAFEPKTRTRVLMSPILLTSLPISLSGRKGLGALALTARQIQQLHQLDFCGSFVSSPPFFSLRLLI